MPYDLSTAKILIVDDMVPMLTLTKSILSIFGFKHLYTAQGAEEAMKILIKEDPDLVITDWMMKPKKRAGIHKRNSKKTPNHQTPMFQWL